MSPAPDKCRSQRADLQDGELLILAEAQALKEDPVLLFALKVENLRFAPPIATAWSGEEEE